MPHLVWPEWLPQPLVNALLASVTRYSEKKRAFLSRFTYDEEFSVTEINQAPKVIWLKRRFSDAMTIDILEDNWFSMIGAMLHKMLEDHAPSNHVVEERQWVILDIDGKRVLFHGEPDVYDPKKVEVDYKFVSASALMYDHQGYIDQLRANAFLLAARGKPVERIMNAYCMRYIDRQKKKQDPDYPQTNVVIKEYPLLPVAETEKVITDKIRRILAAKPLHWRKLPDCTPDERWEHGTWGVYTKYKDKKRSDEWSTKAKGRFQKEKDARAFAGEHQEETKVEYKKGYPTLCDYCNVIQWCQQRQKELKEEANRKSEHTVRDDD